MALLSYLFQRARLMTIMAILAGFGSGLSSAALIAAISRQLTQQAPTTPLFIAAFAALLLFVLITDLAAKWLLMRLSAGITYTLRLELARRILSTPLRQLEVIGNPTLVGALVEDIRVVSLALHQLPSVCIGLTVILGCATYPPGSPPRYLPYWRCRRCLPSPSIGICTGRPSRLYVNCWRCATSVISTLPA